MGFGRTLTAAFYLKRLLVTAAVQRIVWLTPKATLSQREFDLSRLDLPVQTHPPCDYDVTKPLLYLATPQFVLETFDRTPYTFDFIVIDEFYPQQRAWLYRVLQRTKACPHLELSSGAEPPLLAKWAQRPFTTFAHAATATTPPEANDSAELQALLQIVRPNSEPSSS